MRPRGSNFESVWVMNRRMACTHSSPRSQHLLIVEPDPLFRLLLCVALAGQFSDFHAVGSFKEARKLLAGQNFSAMVAEQHLVDGTGLDLYAGVRRASASTPFILMCGGESVTIDDSHYRFFAKPFALAEFANSLSKMIAARPQR